MKNDISKLNSENKEVYFKMTKYLSEKRLKKSEYFRVCEDILLMLLDAQERGEPLEAVFPDGFQTFCDEVAKNCIKEKWYETVLNMLFCAFTVLFVITILEVLSVKFLADGSEWISGVNMRLGRGSFIGAILSSVIAMAAFVLSSKLVFKKIIFNRGFGYYFYLFLMIAVSIGIATLILRLTVKSGFIRLNWVAFACGAAGAAVIIKVALYVLSKLYDKKK